MIIDKTIKIKWNPNNIKYYKSLGYKYTKMNDEFEVDIDDLSPSSNVRIKIKCDYTEDDCNEIFYIRWADYTKINNNSIIKKDCCKNKKCMMAKQKETNYKKYGTEYHITSPVIREKIKNTNFKKYGVENVFSSDKIKEKIKNTNLEKYGFENVLLNQDIRNKIKDTNLKKYGVENVFSSNIIKEKIKNTNLEKYGFECILSSPIIRNKIVETCILKYGVPNYGALYSMNHKGELSPSWKGGCSNFRSERATNDYKNWRKQVFSRDLYTCQCCNAKNYLGLKKIVKLNAHHIYNWKDNERLRYEPNNGITLCEKCHIEFHSIYR